MQVRLSKDFVKHFRKRIPQDSSLEKKYKKRVTLFIKDRKNRQLKDHKLGGNLKGYRAFSVSGDLRVVYVEQSQDIVMFIDIGTHNQVYS